MSWVEESRARAGGSAAPVQVEPQKNTADSWVAQSRARAAANDAEKAERFAAAAELEAVGKQALAQSFSPQSIGMAEQSLKMWESGQTNTEEKAAQNALPEWRQHVRENSAKVADMAFRNAQAAREHENVVKSALGIDKQERADADRRQLRFDVAKSEFGADDLSAAVFANNTPDEVKRVIVNGGYGVPNQFRREMTDEESKTYKVIAATEGFEAAEKYMSDIGMELSRRPFDEMAEENPVLASVASIPINTVSTMGTFQNLVDVARGRGINPYNAFNLSSSAVSAIRSTVADMTDSQAGAFFYNTAMSIADMGWSTLLGGMAFGAGGDTVRVALQKAQPFIQGLMSSSAATATTVEAKARGLDDTQSLMLGVVAGAVEMLTEKYSIEALLSDPKSAIAYWLKNVVTEGSEEALSNVMNTVADVMIAGDKSHFLANMNYYMTEEGMDEKGAFNAAFLDKLKDVGVDALAGMLSGGLMAGPISIYTGIQNARAKRAGATQSTPAESPSWVQQSQERAAGLREVAQTVMPQQGTQADAQTVQQFAEKIGRTVVFENTAETQGFKSDGYIDADGTIHIDNETVNPLDFVVKHELTHYLQNFKAEYTSFERAAFRSKPFATWLTGKTATIGETVAQLQQVATYAMQSQNLSAEQQQVLQRAVSKLQAVAENGMGRSVHQQQAAYVALKQAQYAVSSNGALDLSVTEAKNEMLANFAAESLFADEGRGLMEIADGITNTKQRNAFVQKILDFINYIKERLVGLNARFDTAQLERMYTKLLGDENAEGGSENFLIPESGKKITADMSDTERAEIIAGKTILAPTYEGQADSIIAEKESDLQSAKSGLVKKAMLAIYDQFRVEDSLYNPDMDIVVEMSNGSVKESANKQIENREQLAKLFPMLEQAVEGAVGIECHENRYYGDADTRDFVELLGGYVEGDYFVPVRFGIKRTGGGKNALYVIISENKMEAEVVKTVSNAYAQKTASRLASNISIHKVIQNVNSENTGLLKYLPDDLLNAEQLAGKRQGIAQTEQYTADKNNRAYEKFVSGGNVRDAQAMLRRRAVDAGFADNGQGRYTNARGDEKSSEITFDDNGKLIPFSERYNADLSDPRYSIPEDAQTLLERFQRGEVSEAEYLAENRRLFDQAREEYGTIPEGENAAVDVRMPKKVADNENVRRFTRTVIETGEVSREAANALGAEVLLGNFSYDPISDAAAMEYARDKVKKGLGRDLWNKALHGALGELRNGKNTVAIGEELLSQAIKANDTAEILSLTAELSEVFTRAGQTVQAARLFKQMTGIGKLVTYQKHVNALNEDIQKRNKKAKPITIDPTIAELLAEATTQADIEYIDGLIVADVAEQVPSTFRDKWNAWRYMAMLVNPTTHIRNVLGNAVFVPSIRLKDAIGAIAEKALPQDQRTKSLIVKKEYADFAKQDAKAEDVRKAMQGNGKFNDENPLLEERRIFKNGALEFVRKSNMDLLGAEDALFKNAHYVHALAGYLQARGVDVSNVDPETLWAARAYAVDEAFKNTYNDASAFGNLISKVAKQNAAADVIVGGLLPFKRTPINIMKRGVEYSPIGLLDTLTRDVYRLRKGKITATEFIDSLSAGMAGTLSYALGMLLVSLGWVTGGFGDDKEDKFRQLNGEQEYALQLFGKSYTIDWTAPTCISFFMGAETMREIAKGRDGFKFSDITDSMWNSLEPMINMSMLSGIQDTIEAAKFAGENETMASIMQSVVTSYLTQAVPTLGGKIASTIDDTRRSNYVDKTSPVDTGLQKIGNKVLSKIPWASSLRNPYIDAWGREEVDKSVVGRIFSNFLSPGYYSEVEYDEVNSELYRIYQEAGDEAVFPESAPKYFNVGGERKDLSAEEYVTFAKARGQVAFDYITEFMDHEDYAGLSDYQRSEIVANLYNYATDQAKAEVSAFDAEEKYKAVTDYTENGGSVVGYYIRKAFVPSGMTDAEYDEFLDLTKDMKSTDDVTRSEQVREYLDTLAVSDQQKSEMYFGACGKDKTLDKYLACGLDEAQAKSFVWQTVGITSDKDTDGKTISGSKKANVCKAIDDFCDERGLSKEVKYRLYAACGYKESKASDVPWYQPSDENRDWFDDLW